MNINEIQDSIAAEFSGFRDRLEMYEYLVKLAGEVEPLDEKYKTESNLVGGCQSKLWLAAECENGRMEFFADSDALITKGIVSLLLRVVNRRPPGEIAEADLYFIEKIGLKSNLSPARSNGVNSAIEAIKRTAEEGCEKSRTDKN